MIIPAGKVRHQVNQGPFKNESTWNELLHKFAITGAELGGNGKPAPKPPAKPPVDPNLQKALGPGSNNPGMSGKPPRGSAMPGAEDRMPGEPILPDTKQNPAPTQPASEFLQSKGTANDEGVDQAVTEEQAKVQRTLEMLKMQDSVIGNLGRDGGGLFMLTLQQAQPSSGGAMGQPQQAGTEFKPVNWGKLVAQIMQSVHGRAESMELAKDKMSIKVKYKTNSAPEKVEYPS